MFQHFTTCFSFHPHDMQETVAASRNSLSVREFLKVLFQYKNCINILVFQIAKPSDVVYEYMMKSLREG